MHPTRRARDHLWALAASNGLPRNRVDDVLSLVGLAEVGAKRVGGFSLGMRQRLGLAAAMLGDPATLAQECLDTSTSAYGDGVGDARDDASGAAAQRWAVRAG